MARHGGLPRDIVKRYGVSKKAWAVYRARHGGRRKSHRHRRNPTGHPLSGSSYRPRFRVSRSGIRHGPRFAAVPQRRRLRRARVTVHHRRVRRNPTPPRRADGRFRRRMRRSRRGSVGYRSHSGRSLSLRGGGRSAKGFVQKYIPLTTQASRHSIRMYKGHALVGGVAGLLVTSVASSAGGTVFGLVVTVGGGIAIRLATKSHTKWEAAAAGFVVGGLIAVGLNALAGGSLTGTAKLGATMTNLKRLAARVRVSGLRGIGDASSQGLFGKPLAALQSELAKQGLKLPALAGGKKLGDYFNGETYNPVTEVGGRSLGRNAQGWMVPGTTGY